MSNTVIDTILRRRSVRSYSDRPVDDEAVELLLRAAMAAPSSKNRQPWEFVVVRERETLDALAGRLRFAKMLHQAPMAIAVCAKSDDNPCWAQDASAAAENLLLAAESLGLGAVWTAAYDEERRSAVVEILEIPEGYSPLCVIPVGYPAGDEKPKDKWKPEKVHYGKW